MYTFKLSNKKKNKNKVIQFLSNYLDMHWTTDWDFISWNQTDGCYRKNINIKQPKTGIIVVVVKIIPNSSD